MLRRKEVGNPIDYFDKSFDEYKAGFESRGKYLYPRLLVTYQNKLVEGSFMIPFSYSGELWLGLENLSRLTSEGNYSLRITLEDFDRKSYVAVFDQFKVITTMMILMLALMTVMVQVGPGDDYVLKVGGFDGPFSTLGDSMTIHSLDGMRFSTR